MFNETNSQILHQETSLITNTQKQRKFLLLQYQNVGLNKEKELNNTYDDEFVTYDQIHSQRSQNKFRGQGGCNQEKKKKILA